MVTLDDIAAAVKTRCGVAAFTEALPGGLWLDRGPEEPTGDYAVFTLEIDGEAEWFSDSSYLQGYKLRMVAYTVQGSAGSTPQAAQLAMAAAVKGSGPTGWAALREGRVNIVLPRGYDGKHEERLREGRDVFAGAGQWFMLIEGTL